MEDEGYEETVSSFYSLFAELQQQPQPPQAEAMDESGGGEEDHGGETGHDCNGASHRK